MALTSVTFRRHDHLVSVLFGAIPTTQMFLYLVCVVFACQHNILEMFCILFMVVALATTVSALVDEGTVG